MGVEFFPCLVCQEIICDTGDYETCGGCGRHWCTPECAMKDGFIIEDEEDPNHDTCNFCRQEDFEDWKILHYLMKKYNLDRPAIIQEMKRNYDNEKESTIHRGS